MRRNLLPILIKQWPRNVIYQARSVSYSTIRFSNSRKDEEYLRDDLALSGINLDDVDELMAGEENRLTNSSRYYPNSNITQGLKSKPFHGHNVVVVQPWQTIANFDEYTDPDLQLAECVSLANTLPNWTVIGKKVIFARHVNKKEVFGRKAFDEFKDFVYSHDGVSALFIGMETLSGIQLSTLEQGLNLPVYDRFTMVLNIFRHHATTKEAKLQIALAELPYIRSHLREIHDSSDYSSSAESLKMLIGGAGEKFYHDRLNILNKRQNKLVSMLKDIRKQRDLTKKQRLKNKVPTVAVVGYTNSGKTSLIKYMTNDESVCPKDQLFATLDVTVHGCSLPSCNHVLMVDTVGFISRIPTLLIGAFSATLQDVQDSNLIVHVLDVTHPDHKLQYVTVLNALKSLNVSKKLIDTRITIGNKFDLIQSDTKQIPQNMAKCDFYVSTTIGQNMSNFARELDRKLSDSLGLTQVRLRVDNGGPKYVWLQKNGSIMECKPDPADENLLICLVKLDKKSFGRWNKLYGQDDIISDT